MDPGSRFARPGRQGSMLTARAIRALLWKEMPLWGADREDADVVGVEHGYSMSIWGERNSNCVWSHLDRLLILGNTRGVPKVERRIAMKHNEPAKWIPGKRIDGALVDRIGRNLLTTCDAEHSDHLVGRCGDHATVTIDRQPVKRIVSLDMSYEITRFGINDHDV